jgi:hypothetical protein
MNMNATHLRVICYSTISFLLAFCLFSLVSMATGCGGAQAPVQYPVIESASGEAEITVSWYGLPAQFIVEAAAGDGVVACVNVAGWIEVCEDFNESEESAEGDSGSPEPPEPAEPSEGSSEPAAE